MLTARRCSFLSCSNLMYGLMRLEGFTSSSTIFSIWRARDVACRDFDAFAEKRLTNAWRFAICTFFFAFSTDTRSRACVAAIMYSS